MPILEIPWLSLEAGGTADDLGEDVGRAFRRSTSMACLIISVGLALLVVWLFDIKLEKTSAIEKRAVALVAFSLVCFGLARAYSLRLARASARSNRARSETLQHIDRLKLLHQITQATAERRIPTNVFEVVVRQLEDHLPADFVGVCDYDKPSQTLEFASIGTKASVLARALAVAEHQKLSVEASGLEPCLAGRLIYEEDVSKIPLPLTRRLAECGLRSLVLAPLQTENRVHGILLVARLDPESFTPGECEFLLQLGESVALASLQAELHLALQRAYFDLRETQQSVLHEDRLRVLGQMASGIAHDINNSIAPAALLAESLIDQEKGLSPKGRSRLETVLHAIRDVADTVSRMQVLYRRRKVKKPPDLIDLNPLVKQVIELTRSKWRDSPQESGHVIEIIWQLATDLPLVRGIESEIREALTNLVLNAVDAMPTGGRLTLSTRQSFERNVPPPGTPRRQVAELEVSDSGSGMDEETRRRCFEPFFTTKGEYGTGLGLPMVFSVAESHDADIEVDSALGEGTTVRLLFPVLGAEPTTQTVEPLGGRSMSRHLLVVDDDLILLETLHDILAGDGHNVISASGGEAGIEAFLAERAAGTPFDLVLTDLGMPEVDGRRVAEAVKMGEPSTPVILLTGWGHGMLASGERPAHVDLILNKPPRLEELRRAVKMALSQN